MTSWSLVYEGFDPGQEGRRETLCTLGNGYFATRGAAPESSAGGVHYPGTYLAGGYNRLESEVAGRVIENEDLANMPNWLPLTFRAPGVDWFSLDAVEIRSYRQELDLRSGVLIRVFAFRDAKGRDTKVVERRLVHMARPHLAALETVVIPENWSGALEVQSGLDGEVTNAGVERYKALNGKHLEVLEAGPTGAQTLFVKVRTVQSRIEVAEAVRTEVYVSGKRVEMERETHQEGGRVWQTFKIEARQGEAVNIEKTLALHTSRDHAISECGLQARKEISRTPRFEALLRDHARAWDQLWRRFDLEIEPETGKDGEGRIGAILHLHLFHLLQTSSPHTMDLDVGVPPRGWHGEAYRGHIMWDELFIFPILNLRLPEITRSLIKYRHRRLGEARAAAREAGFRGAMYPWQSGSDGREESQRIHLNPNSGEWIPDNSRRQRHVNSAIAYNVWNYYQATGDVEFLSFCGAEMLLEIARFWASIATYNPELDRYEIHGVMGPDEFHEGYPDSDQGGLSNNAYTNVTAVWSLCRALESLGHVPPQRREELLRKLELTPDELGHWEDISRKMVIPFHDGGVISQFEGYERLKEFDWEGYREKYGDIHRLDRILKAEDDTPDRYKASKQADVLMLFYLFSSEELSGLFERLGYELTPEMIPKNIDYHSQRTSHGSTLSWVVHSWVLARADRPHYWELFQQALHSDVEDIQGGTTSEGIHLGAMAGTVDFMQRISTGVETREDVLWFNPYIPEPLARLRLNLRYRGHSLQVCVTRNSFKLTSDPARAAPIRVGVGGEVFELEPGSAQEWPLSKK